MTQAAEAEWLRLLNDIHEKVTDLGTRLSAEDSAIKTDIAVIKRDVAQLKRMTETFVPRSEIDDIKHEQEDFVTQDEFGPVRRLVYGAVGLLLATVLLYVLARSGIGTTS